MKRITCILLALSLVCCFFGCSKSKNADEMTSQMENSPTQEKSNDEQENVQPENDMKEPMTSESWGVSKQYAASNEVSNECFSIHFPYVTGASYLHGLVASQGDDTMVLLSSQNDSSPVINDVSELFPAYFEQMQHTLEKYYGLLSSDYQLTLTSNSPADVGDYAMHTFSGTIAFDYDGTPRMYQFVAYATTLQSNGAYAFWTVFDISDEQSNGALISEHALNMAKTFREP